MHNLILVVSCFFFLSLFASSAGGQEVKTIDSKGLKDLLTANKGKVVVLDFWGSF
jgi:hypothetical protein